MTLSPLPLTTMSQHSTTPPASHALGMSQSHSDGHGGERPSAYALAAKAMQPKSMLPQPQRGPAKLLLKAKKAQERQQQAQLQAQQQAAASVGQARSAPSTMMPSQAPAAKKAKLDLTAKASVAGSGDEGQGQASLAKVGVVVKQEKDAKKEENTVYAVE